MTEQTLSFVEPSQLRSTWLEIRDRVAQLAIDRKQPWIADDVFHELLIGNAYLWALPDMSGFLVIRVFATAYERALHVWICCNASEDPIKDYVPQLNDIAKAADCSVVTFESDRKYHRALPGVRAVYAYSMEVES